MPEGAKALPKQTAQNHGASHELPGAFTLFKPSESVVLANLSAYLLLAGVPALLTLMDGFSRYGHTGVNAVLMPHGAWAAGDLLGLLVSILFAPGLICLQMATINKKALSFSEAFQQGLSYLWRFILLGIVMTVLLFVSFVLFIVPFFFVLPRVLLAPYYLIDRDLNVSDALSASNKAYKEHGKLWGVVGVTVLLSLPGAIPFVGTIIGAVLTFLYGPAFAMRYEQYKLLEAGKSPQTPAEVDVAKGQKA